MIAWSGPDVSFTSNRSLEDGHSLFPDPVIANSAMDRIAHNAHQITMTGESFRMSSKNYLKNYFQKRCNKPVILILTDNATSMISVREKHDAISLRLHRIFLKADEGVLDEVAGFIRGKEGRTPAIKAFIRNNKSYLKDSPPRTVTINPHGRFYNLTDIFNSLNRDYFDDRVAALITWGKRSSRYAVRKRTLGSYQKKTNTIRIHPILDRRKVPRNVIEFVVYHEMLHVVIDTVVKNGRRSIHSKEFKSREHEYENYDKAIEWEKRVSCCNH